MLSITRSPVRAVQTHFQWEQTTERASANQPQVTKKAGRPDGQAELRKTLTVDDMVLGVVRGMMALYEAKESLAVLK